jgi:hypothetical protein
MEINSHYDWLEKYLPSIFKSLGIEWNLYCGIIVADGDKCYGYADLFKRNGIPFEHGVAMYMLSKTSKYPNQCRETSSGWVPVQEWIIKTYPSLKQYFDGREL